MQTRRDDREGGISPQEVAIARSRCKLGDVVEVRTYKSRLDDSLSRGGAIRAGVVVGKYPRFATVWLPGGIIDSVSWVEMAMRTRGK